MIPTQAQVQGLAALAVHEPGRAFDQDVLEMTATARHARQGAVTIAARQAMTMAGPCEPGDVLGVIAGDFARRRPRTSTRSPPRCSTGCWAAVASWSRSSSGADDADGALAARCAALGRGAAPRCRRRGVRRWPGALPAPDVGGVSRPEEEQPVISLDSPVETILGGAGDAKAKKKRERIVEGLGLRTVGDLLRHFPRRYVKTGELTRVDDLEEGRC